MAMDGKKSNLLKKRKDDMNSRRGEGEETFQASTQKSILSNQRKIEKFMEAFDASQDMFLGKVVLEVGCYGAGLLAMLAVKVKHFLTFSVSISLFAPRPVPPG